MWIHRSSISTKKPLFETIPQEQTIEEQKLLKLFSSLEPQFDSYSIFRIQQVISEL